jgi:hypothetical protein
MQSLVSTCTKWFCLSLKLRVLSNWATLYGLWRK